MKAYLAGPMRGIKAFNFPAFRSAVVALRDVGHEIISPHEMDEDSGFDFTGCTGNEDLADLDFDITQRLIGDIFAIAECDAVICLDGWYLSNGARTEVHFALATGRKVYQFEVAHRFNGYQHSLQEICSVGSIPIEDLSQEPTTW